ncbi:MAG: bifunctional diaminohydroxyphosphoribosylaminopyrimidine deaminase/5-amino-6-(5-phosphoribosylamino)uracil reductase RibD [Gammaproteobacteria bacterium]|nr:bifunctional diaminohydroxyphosphoribosylaminopyrimidine deaminase/5-amino-6-(5-phosphoribosylamino)uracil reductase RibD [Gammaproteobacteria bacterium]MBL7000849.1 bifunctional diaminohydroxyphosphoribosylaminopyrimidine deaminase/5-amino-6-(5-phosphoribosylamino)uracil reductase RibD [Gammaproteobacteria bacterium]
MSFSHNHEFWMARALQLARQGLYSTHPNPRVGCVIVRNDQSIAEGFHAVPGGPHAEVNALHQLNGDATGATVYVTLEPCSHSGKTPPCVDALIQARPKTVVIAMQDPNPLVCGRGIRKLNEHGIEVIVDVLAPQAAELNAGFIKRMQHKMPWVRLKMAMSLDGRTALSNGLSQWISGPEARQDVQFLRASSSAILSTAKTVLRDDAALNVRLDSQQLKQSVKVRQPVRVIIDNQLRLSGKEKLFELEGEIWIFTSSRDDVLLQNFKRANTRVFILPPDSKGRVDLLQLLHKLAELEINEVHTECGATLSGALIQQGLVDELIVYMAPDLMGDQAQGLFDLGEISIMSDKVQLSISDVRMIGRDIKIWAKPQSTCLR